MKKISFEDCKGLLMSVRQMFERRVELFEEIVKFEYGTWGYIDLIKEKDGQLCWLDGFCDAAGFFLKTNKQRLLSVFYEIWERDIFLWKHGDGNTTDADGNVIRDTEKTLERMYEYILRRIGGPANTENITGVL